jgi:hypothetical protein
MIVLSLFLPPSRQEQPMRPTDRNRFRKDAEARFPIKVDMPVPPSGLFFATGAFTTSRADEASRGPVAEVIC